MRLKIPGNFFSSANKPKLFSATKQKKTFSFMTWNKKKFEELIVFMFSLSFVFYPPYGRVFLYFML